jgi:hypothetical protein
MQVPINVKSPNNISKWQIGFNSAFKGLSIIKSVSWYCLSCSGRPPALLTLGVRYCLTEGEGAGYTLQLRQIPWPSFHFTAELWIEASANHDSVF